MTGAGEHRTLRHRSCSAPTALDGQQHRRSAGERHDRDRYRGHVHAGADQLVGNNASFWGNGVIAANTTYSTVRSRRSRA